MSDNDVDKQVVDQLYWDNSVQVADVGVTVDDGWVTLEGSVPSYSAKYTAEDDAYLVDGVKFVDNQLVVNYPTFPTDKQIKEDVKSALDWDFALDSQRIKVSVKDGTVKLLGTVDAYWKKTLAEDDAAKVNGVLYIVNELAIVTTGKWSDETIGKDIEEAMRRNIFVDVNDVDVKVKKGKVTLTGEVSNWAAKDAAYSSALFTAGVVSIDNQITIS